MFWGGPREQSIHRRIKECSGERTPESLRFSLVFVPLEQGLTIAGADIALEIIEFQNNVDQLFFNHQKQRGCKIGVARGCVGLTSKKATESVDRKCLGARQTAGEKGVA